MVMLVLVWREEEGLANSLPPRENGVEGRQVHTEGQEQAWRL